MDRCLMLAAVSTVTSTQDLRALFAADQDGLQSQRQSALHHAGAPSSTHNTLAAQQPTPSANASASTAKAPPPAPDRPGRTPYVGWGGQTIPSSSSFRVPWFGRNRNKGPNARPKSAAGQRNDRASDGPSRSSGRGGGRAGDALAVEEVVAVLQALQPDDPLPEAALSALQYFDSRAVSLLLKDLSKSQLGARAEQLFDHLRNLPPTSPLAPLCDVYTYTAMISLCIYQHNADRALELMQDMQARNVERNVHTYTALMNVCIKCGKLQSALDIYNTMRAASCTPNVVTYNTLIDVYGKLGQWDSASQVLDLMKSESVQPVLRTYNTLVIACNMCNQPREALAVYHKMRAQGFQPNATTYNALISAYGKLGQLDKVLEVYDEMVRKNCERGVITYSSLISACEKAGQWELALKLFDDMQQDACTPNTVTYNSLITACGQGAQWEKAQAVFDQMQAQGCTPDVVTYTALISALERGGRWQMALRAFEQMCKQGCRPDAIVYNAIIDTLWETGVAWAQQRAMRLYRQAAKQGHFAQQPLAGAAARVELNLHAMTAGVAMLSLYGWLAELRELVVGQGEEALPAMLAIVTDKGRSSKEQGNYVVREAVAAMLTFWDSPFRMMQDAAYGGVLEADFRGVAQWVVSDSFTAHLNSLLLASDHPQDAPEPTDEAMLAREEQIELHSGRAFEHVEAFEASHCLVLHNMSLAYLNHRPKLLTALMRQGAALGAKDETTHDAILLLDRTVSVSDEVPENLLPLLAAAALSIALKQGEAPAAYPPADALARTTGFPPAAIAKMEFNVRNVLQDDTQAISTLRCLRLYLERLGHSFLDAPSQHALGGLPALLTTEALIDCTLLNCRPSVIAAALLYAERRLRGAVPFWPSMLSKLTGYQDMTSPELTIAVRVAQKLCRQPQFAALYRDRALLHAALARCPPAASPSAALPQHPAAAQPQLQLQQQQQPQQPRLAGALAAAAAAAEGGAGQGLLATCVSGSSSGGGGVLGGLGLEQQLSSGSFNGGGGGGGGQMYAASPAASPSVGSSWQHHDPHQHQHHHHPQHSHLHQPHPHLHQPPSHMGHSHMGGMDAGNGMMMVGHQQQLHHLQHQHPHHQRAATPQMLHLGGGIGGAHAMHHPMDPMMGPQEPLPRMDSLGHAMTSQSLQGLSLGAPLQPPRQHNPPPSIYHLPPSM